MSENIQIRLVELTQHWNEHDPVSAIQQKRAHDLGVALNEFGGKDEMLSAYYRAKAFNRCASVLQYYWDGIGDWRA